MKKIIALLVICCMAFSSAGVFAAEKEAAVSAIPSGYSFMQAMGLATPAAPGGETVSRGDFIAAVMGLLKLDISAAAEELPFTDVDKDSAAAAALHYALGLDIIAECDMYYPDRAVTYAEAFKTAVSAMGAQAEAARRGGYPSGYLYSAERLGLTKGLDYSLNADMTANDFYTLLYNMAGGDVQVVYEMSENGGKTVFRNNRQNLLSAYWDMFKVKGVVKANEASYLNDASISAGKGVIIIGDDEYSADMFEYPLGSRVEGYAKDGKGAAHELVYGEIISSSAVVEADSGASISGAVISYTDDGGIDRKLYLDNDFAVILNGKAYDRFNADTLNSGRNRLALIDNDSDGQYDVLSIMRADYIEVSSVDERLGYIYGSDNQGSIKVSENNVLKITSGAKDIPLTDAGGKYFEYYSSADGRLVEMTELTEQRSGTVTAMEKGEGIIYLDGEKITCTEYFKNIFLSEIKNGDKVILLLSTDGAAAFTEMTESGKYIYAYLYDVSKPETAITKIVNVKMLNEEGEFLICRLADRLTIDDDKKTSAEAYDFLTDKGEMLVRYHPDSAGLINCINTEYAASELPEDKGIKRYMYKGYDSADKLYYNRSAGYLMPYFTIDASTPVFIVCTDSTVEEKRRYSLAGDLGFLANGSTPASNTLWAYNVDDNGRADALVRKTSGTSGFQVSSESSFGVVQSFTRALNTEGEDSLKLVLYAADKFNSYYLDESEAFLTSIRSGKEIISKLVPGDVIRYRLDSHGNICDIALDFEGDTRTVKYTENRMGGITYDYGRLNSVGASSLTVIVTNAAGESETRAFFWQSGLPGLVDERGNVKTVSRSSLVGYIQDNVSCDNVLVITNRGTYKQVVVYKDASN